MVAEGWQVADQTDAQMDQAAEIKGKIKSAGYEIKACLAGIREEEKFTPIASHFPDPNTGKFSMEQLSDTSIPDNEQAKLVAQYYDEAMTCRRPAVDKIVQLAPASSDAFEQHSAQNEAITKRLVQHQATWGDFAQSAEANQAELRTKLGYIHL